MQLTCISLNLWDGGLLLPNILKFLDEHREADIFLFQEAYNATDPALVDNYRSVEILKAKLGLPYSDFAPMVLDRLPIGKLDNGTFILSRYPITGTDVQFFDEPYGERDPNDPKSWPITPRILQHAVLDVEGKPLDVFNLHGVWDLDGDNYSPERQNMSRVIREQVHGKERVILAGDSNARPTNQAMRELEEELVSVFGTAIKTTYNMRRKENPGYATAACDVMYVSTNIKVLKKDCPDVDISDHLPLVVTLEVA